MIATALPWELGIVRRLRALPLRSFVLAESVQTLYFGVDFIYGVLLIVLTRSYKSLIHMGHTILA